MFTTFSSEKLISVGNKHSWVNIFLKRVTVMVESQHLSIL